MIFRTEKSHYFYAFALNDVLTVRQCIYTNNWLSKKDAPVSSDVFTYLRLDLTMFSYWAMSNFGETDFNSLIKL